MSDNLHIKYRAEPTARRFHQSTAAVRGIMGPIGSGKSVACVMELFRRARGQRPLNDGKRRTRWAVIRNTYPELKSTTIKTFQEWIPEDISRWKWDPPITCWIKFDDVEAEIIFLALDQPKDVRKLLSLELTGAWVNEARELNYDVIRAVNSRIGRYPSKADGGFEWCGLIMDTNPPDDDSWWFKYAEKEKPKNWEFFKQPPAIVMLANGEYGPNEQAENIRNHTLGYEYWLRQVSGNTPDWIKVMLMGQYGTVIDGKPVFTDYVDSTHCANKALEPIKGLPIYLGFDYGRTPACAFVQMSPKGQIRVIDELLVDADGAGNGMGIRSFMREVVMPYIRNNFAEYQFIAYGDPAGAGLQQGDDISCMDIQNEEGMVVLPAPGNNDPSVRVDAIAKHLKTMVDGEPGLLISQKCSVIRKALNGGYRHKRMQVAGDTRYADKPEKNRFSHIAEALEYAVLGMNERLGMPTAVAPKVNRRSSRGWT